MQSSVAPGGLLALAFALACPSAAGAAAVLTTPSTVLPGTSFTATLSLDAPWPLSDVELVDQIDIHLTYDSSILALTQADAIGLLLDEDGDPPLVLASPGQDTTASFLLGQHPFGPGELVRYHFTWLGNATAGSTVVQAAVVPSMYDFDTGGLRNLDTAQQGASAQVQAVPEPATWMSLICGLGLVILAGKAARTPPRAMHD